MNQKERAEEFKALHQKDRPLLLFNAWDISSAHAIAKSASAIGTSSGAVAAAHGYGDGEKHPLDAVLAFVSRLCTAVQLPVSVDLEAGYSDSPDGVALIAQKVIEAGAIGINLEDGLINRERKMTTALAHAQKIASIRKCAERLAIPLFINARTDSFLLNPNDSSAALAETIKRAAIYADAGADGLFVPGLTELGQIAELTALTKLPINIMAVEGIASVEELAQVGVKRISCGAWPMLAAMRWIARAAAAFAQDGTYPGRAR